ncbi:MAG: hypothetical protein RLZZ455_876 [Candidatus Parcubacteria bacterium]|jgi:adenine-specific DNA-methyltransferase
MSDQKNKLNRKAIVNLKELLKSDAPYLVEDGKVNLDKLKGMLTGKTTEKEDDRFYFNWAGKDKVFQAIQAPAYSTLAPQKDKSIGWDETENLMIVGENLETLKLLLKPYFGKVKVIYIDPPYNTGKDFIYKDDFSSPLKDYLERTGQKGADGEKLTTNSETNGRYHSDWLNFMYPRLFMARNLLKDDGLIFISIDDHEVHHLRMIMDDIFGEENFITQFIWNTEGHTDNQLDVKVNHEYVILYARNSLDASLEYVVDPNTRENSNLWKGFAENSITKNGTANPPSEVVLPIGFPCKKESLTLAPSNVGGDFFEAINKQKYISRIITDKWSVSYPVRLDEMEISNHKLTKPCKVFSGWANLNKLKEFINNGCNPIKDGDDDVSFFLSENGVIYYHREREKARNIVSVLRNLGTTEKMRSELESDGIIFQYPKPKELLSYLFKISTGDDDLILDFFAGSGTTAQSVFELNLDDKQSRKFILVQIQEEIEAKSHARDLGFGTVSDICLARLKKLSDKNSNSLSYKVFELKPSNFNLKEEFELAENKDLGEIKTNYLKELGLYVDQPTVATANTLNIVYEIILKNGFSLNAKIEELKLGSNNFYKVNDTENDLEIHISLDAKIEDGSVEAIRTAEYKDKTFAFYDNALTDSQKINLNTFVKLQVI